MEFSRIIFLRVHVLFQQEFQVFRAHSETNDTAKGFIVDVLWKIFSRMTSSTSEKEIIDESLIQDSKERSHELKSVRLDDSSKEGQDLAQQPYTSTIEAEGKATFKNHIGIEEQSIYNSNGVNSSEASDVYVLGKEVVNVPSINITNNFGNTMVCDNSHFNVQPPKTEVETKIQNKESNPGVLKRLIFDGKQLSESQLKYGLANTHNRSEFCLERTVASEATFKVYTAINHCQHIDIKDNSSVINIPASTLGNINIFNNFGIIIVCDNMMLNYFNVLPNNDTVLSMRNKDGKQLDAGLNIEYDLANAYNRSEFCLGRFIGSSTTEDEATFKAHNATSHQPIQIHNNTSIMIITACDKRFEASDVAALSEEPANMLNVKITNNFGSTVVCDNSQVNIDTKPNDTIEIVNIQVEKAASPDQQRLIFNGKHLDDGLSNTKSSLTNRSEFCQP